MVGLFLNTLYFFGIDNSLVLRQYNKILDCPCGASSFAVEANKLGIKVIGCDPLFDATVERLVQVGKEDIDQVIQRVKLTPDLTNGISIDQ